MNIKGFIKRKLINNGQYYKLKYSTLFNIYQRLFKPEVIKQHKKEVNLYSRILGECNLIFDIGANDGHKTAAFLELSKHVVSCEPDSLSYQILKTRFRYNKRVDVLNLAIFNTMGELTLHRNGEGSAFNTLNKQWMEILESDNEERWNEKIVFNDNLSIRVKTTTLDDLINRFGTPDFIKIDVEGSELEVLEGLSAGVPAISFECLVPEFLDQAIRILGILRRFDDKYKFNVIYEEELMFSDHVSYAQINEWLKTTDLFAFDLLATT
jgi:FkbM family methyltransferase